MGQSIIDLGGFSGIIWLTPCTALPWVMIGDFNAILLALEKFNTSAPSPTSVKEFSDMVLDAGFMDLGFKGNKYTWANNRQGHFYVAARLDRAFANAA